MGGLGCLLRGAGGRFLNRNICRLKCIRGTGANGSSIFLGGRLGSSEGIGSF